MIRILFVDDQQRELDGIQRMMNWTELGIEIAGAVTNAHAALEIVERESVDIVVTDIIMQNMDGLTLVRELKARFPQIKTICISGFDDFKFVSLAMNNGAAGYVLKPILVNEFKAVLERAMGDILTARSQSKAVFDKSRLAMMCLDAKDWRDGLEEEELSRVVRVARAGRGVKIENAWVCLELSDGSRICVLDGDQAVPEQVCASDPVALSQARMGYLQVCAEMADGGQMNGAGDVVARIKQNVDAHLSEELDSETLLQGVYLSASYASALFKESTGMTLHRYVMQRRLETAVQLMLDSPQMLIKDIAWKCGFSDASHFINSFRQVYHMTPDKYRRRHAAK